MLKRSTLAATLLALSGAAHAQSVEFRIIERQGQTAIPIPFGATPTTDNVLNFAIQARVVGGTPTQFLGNFSFDIVATGEADTSGTLTRLATSSATGAYLPNNTQTGNAGAGGFAGLAAIYAYLAGIMPNFNGLINVSGGSFTNTPGNQEIGLVTGSPTGAGLLLLTDLTGPSGIGDPDGNPDTYSGTGTTAPIDPTIATMFLGAGGNFVDIYRFKYTTTNSTQRTITFHLANPTAEIGSSLQLSNGVWGPIQANAPFTTGAISIMVAANGACCDNATGACSLTAPGACTGAFMAGLCQPNPCPQPGACCDLAGACTFVLQSACTAVWNAGAACQPNICPQPGTCCAPSGACTFVPNSACTFSWTLGGACQPNPCPQPGTCCAASGLCSLGFQSSCTGIWTLGGACTPNPCPQPGRCCTSAGPCIIILQSACIGDWSATGGCAPSPCPGACCLGTACTFTDEMTCLMGMQGDFHGAASSCGTSANPISCCPANFNMSGGLSAQDIFDYLAAWFAGDPRADFDHDGHLSPYDIFAFLHAWFVGC